MQTKMLYLIRGLPGAGKSTLSETIANQDRFVFQIEADEYFINGDGVYVWNAKRVHHAHKWCFDTTENLMKFGHDGIVSNTFTTEKELKPYLDLAVKYGYSVTSMIVENRHGNASIHDVPEETMQKMRNRFSVKL
jgi:predicted kinase